jgi:adenylate cyclase
LALKMFQFAGHTLDLTRSSLRVADREVELRPKSFEVLRYLVENSDRLVTKDELIKAIWPDVVVADESLTHCVSEVRQAIGDGKQTIIKTVSRRGYRFVAPVSRLSADGRSGLQSPASAGPRAEANPDGGQRPSLPVPDRPSIAVLAFANLSGDSQQDYFSDGITEDIITELSRFSELMVIARNSTFQYKGRSADIRQIGRELGVRYVLEGSVRRDGNRVRISAQLIDAMTGAHRWAERYDRDLSSVFAVQDEVTRKIVTILANHVNKAEAERTLMKPAATWEAYDYYLRGVEAYSSHVFEPAKTPISEVRRLFEKSLSIDPGYARAYAMLSRTRIRTFWDPIDGDHLDPVGIERAYELARKAVRLDANLPLAHLQLALALLFRRRRDEALVELECASALNPNYTDWQCGYGLALAGQSAKAIEVLQENMRLDPFGMPNRFCYIGQASYMLKRYAQAATALRECESRLPDLWTIYVFLVAAHAQLGQFDEAKAAIIQLLRTNPAVTIERTIRSLPYNEPRDVEHLADGLRKAGLPEE